MIDRAEVVFGCKYGTETRTFGKYPNNEPFYKPKLPWNLPSETIEEYSMLLRPKTIDALMAALFYVDAIQERGYYTPHLIFPFALGARQDRLNTSGDFLFTAKSIAKEINLRNFPTVTVVDCHSEVMPALIDRCRNVSLANIIVSPSFSLSGNRYDGVISPDAGAEKRASAVAKVLGLPLYHAWKKRDVATGELTGFGVQELPAWARDTINTNRSIPRYLIVDDICDGGGTFVGLAKHIKEYVVRCDLDLLVTHGLFSQGLKSLATYFDTIYTTDSVLTDVNDLCRNAVQSADFVKQISICTPLIRGEL